VQSRTRFVAPFSAIVFACASSAFAADAPTHTHAAEEPLSAPVLKSTVEAVYPPEALRDGLEGSVDLELTVDESGHVVDAIASAGSGHGFEQAAALAARQFVFEPARRGNRAIRSSVQFTYEFHRPPTPRPATPPPAPAKAPEAVQTGPHQSTLVLASKPMSAASAFSVRARDFQLRPIGSVQDILRVTPGLVLVQHSGGGKANQYFLRGFDVDHGTDLALSIDGIPINMVTHAHGQGFADTNFIIPEVVERVEITKGPYFANQGDFATAGSLNMVSRDDFEHSSFGFGLSGSPGHGSPGFRGLLIASPTFDSGLKATFAAEFGRQNGPFVRPEGWDKYKLFNKITYPINTTSSISIGEMSYGGAWNGSGQIPARAVEQGLISRFGSIDLDEGGYTSRHQTFVQYKLRPSDSSELKALAYVGVYRFNLFSNFTLFTRNANQGDEIEQRDRRTFYGGRLNYRVVREFGGVRFDTNIGGDVRNDDIRGELWNTVHRTATAQVKAADVHETMMGAFANEEIAPTRWLRLNVGARTDMLAFAVDDQLAHVQSAGVPTSGVDSAHQFSPKVSMAASPLSGEKAQVDLYANYGHGFHSNDVRGAFAAPAITPLTRAIGAEVGSRGRFFDKWDVAVALWKLDLASETVWSGDEGTTSVGGSTRRQGVEFETRYEFTKWLAADLDVTFSHSQFKANAGNNNGLALAPKQTYSGGLSGRHELGPGILRGGLRAYGITDRPANDEGDLVATGFSMFDLHAGYRLRYIDIALDIENLFNQSSRAAQFDTTSRMQNEPALGTKVPAQFTCGSTGKLAAGNGAGLFQGCEDIHFTPQYPLTFRVMATMYLD
jgi:TonB family protein